MKITDFDIKISAENVCAFLDGDKTGDLYEEIMDELEEMLPQAYEKIRPVALLESLNHRRVHSPMLAS